MTTNNPLSITPENVKDERICYEFYAQSGQKLYLQSNANVTLIYPNQSSENLKLTDDGGKDIVLSQTGIYSISVLDKDIKNGQITISLESNIPSTSSLSNFPLPSLPSPSINNYRTGRMRIITAYDYNQNIYPIYSQLTYQPLQKPNLQPSQKLQQIVDDVVIFMDSKGMPTTRLSVSLIDLKTSSYAGYSDQEVRFPASVTKLFWMVYLYGQYQSRLLPEGTIPEKQLKKMIQDSDNEAASLIVDTITQTTSSNDLTGSELQIWIQKRLAMNSFFQQAGYSQINISQKLFPTKQFTEPIGRDLQIRLDPADPIRDYATTSDVARLLFEIEAEKSISRKYSKQMKRLLKRSLHPQDWKNKEFNAIEGFLGEGLPQDAYFASKMGWNFSVRNDAAIIGSPDRKHKYILVIFGDDPSFYKDKKLFPEISRMVYQEMTK
ncbi:serine hydrolase [Sphaerospermopsis aphanizomenoides]|uniref:serine hydrolase n=1 Tax=Sphaerospermopsis aphanizomenoides TaxID=459663 RepID=UPI001F2D4855|nr:serine hydrolase [Sphaerospermopsis aphanizomenoides]